MKRTALPVVLLVLFAAGTIQRGTLLVRAAHALPPAQRINTYGQNPAPPATPKDKTCCKCYPFPDNHPICSQ